MLDHSSLASRLTTAIASGDLDAIAALYHDDAVIWRSTDCLELNKRQMLRIMKFLATQVRDLRFDDIRRRATDDGFVQQHIMVCTAPGGEPIHAHACLVGVVRDGRIARISEYIDSVAVAPLLAAPLEG